MAIAHVQTVRTETASAVSSITHSNLAVGSGTNRSLVAYVLWLDLSGTAPQVNSVVFNTSESFTFRARARQTIGGSFLTVEIWTLDNPSNATANVVATLNEAVGAGDGLALVLSEYTGANNGVGANTGTATGNDDNPTTTFTTGTSTSLIVVGAIVYNAYLGAPDGGETERLADNIGYASYGAYDHAATGGSHAIDLSCDANYWSIAAVELKSYTAPATTSLVPPNISRRMSHLFVR